MYKHIMYEILIYDLSPAIIPRFNFSDGRQL
jgi:hypothetical protein